jgi:hypothetical protein
MITIAIATVRYFRLEDSVRQSKIFTPSQIVRSQQPIAFFFVTLAFERQIRLAILALIYGCF